MKLVHGVGFNDKKYPTAVNGKFTKEYDLWKGMLRRCYSSKCHTNQPTYIGCTVSDNFKHYTFFHEWCQNQIGFGLEGSDLDKDIIVPNNKLYSENTCVFVPHEINKFFNDRRVARGNCPIGVYLHKATGKYMARCNVSGKVKYLGLYISPEEAHIVYKLFKESLCKETAAIWKSRVDTRVYTALIDWRVPE